METIEVTIEQLSTIMPYAEESNLRKIIPFLNEAMAKYEINTRLRQAHFIAQVAHESGCFNFLEEISDGADYEGRSDLGNTTTGDGIRYKGRGLIQITGRYNYNEVGKALGVDLINNPTRLANYDLACLSAAWWWYTNQLNEFADINDMRSITTRINGGLNGLSSRLEFLDIAKETFGISDQAELLNRSLNVMPSNLNTVGITPTVGNKPTVRQFYVGEKTPHVLEGSDLEAFNADLENL